MASPGSSSMLSIVIPVFDEERSLPHLVRTLENVLPKVTDAYEIIFVDDGSRDDSVGVLRRLRETNPRIQIYQCRRNFGKSVALDVGFRSATGDVVVTLDADLQDDAEEIPRLLEKLSEGYDVVVGWKIQRKDPIHKRLASKLFNLVTRQVTRLRLHDFNSGFKAYRREVVENVHLYGELHRYIPPIAHWKGFRVTEIGVRHHPRRFGRSKYGSERFLRGFFDLITIAFLTKYGGRPLHFFGPVGTILIVAGTGICGYLTALKISGEDIGLRPLLTLGILLVIIGMLFVSTGLLGEMSLYLHRLRDQDIAGHVIKKVYRGDS